MKILLNTVMIATCILLLLTSASNSQSLEKITGTIGKEKMGSDKIVICVYGTLACMPMNVDTNMSVNYQNTETKLTELPFGLFLEAEYKNDGKGVKFLKKIVIDENKTVICFAELKEDQHKKLGELLTSISAVRTYELKTKSNQVFIEFNSKVLTYKELEDRIKNEGFELE